MATPLLTLTSCQGLKGNSLRSFSIHAPHTGRDLNAASGRFTPKKTDSCCGCSLSKAVANTGMHELRRQLEYKANWYGRQIEVIDRWQPTSKVCSGCGHKLDEMNLSVRQWNCPKCGAEHDRDINAAINILNTARSAEINARGEWLSRGA